MLETRPVTQNLTSVGGSAAADSATGGPDGGGESANVGTAGDDPAGDDITEDAIHGMYADADNDNIDADEEAIERAFCKNNGTF